MSTEPTITIVGRLTTDPELRRTQSGVPVAAFTIVHTPRTFDKQAREWKDGEPLFLRASCWRDLAEHAAKSLTKGTQVIATGTLKPNTYLTKEGEKRTTVELKVDAIGPNLQYTTITLNPVTKTSPHPAREWATTAPPYSDETPF